MTFKKHDLSWISKLKVPGLGFALGFSVCMMFSRFSLYYSFYAGIIGSIVLYGISKMEL